jgi:hypothetical protein
MTTDFVLRTFIALNMQVILKFKLPHVSLRKERKQWD